MQQNPLTLQAVFRLALRQTGGLIGSIMALLSLDLAVPDHSTLSRRAETLEVQRPRPGTRPVHLIVDGTGLKLCGAGEWLIREARGQDTPVVAQVAHWCGCRHGAHRRGHPDGARRR